jgi:hypothetical protein
MKVSVGGVERKEKKRRKEKKKWKEKKKINK